MSSGLMKILHGSSGLMKILHGTFGNEAERAQHFKISASDGAVLDISDFLYMELFGDNLQIFDTKEDETIIAMQKQPEEELLENLHVRQFEQFDQLKQLVALYVQDTAHTSEPDNYTKLKRMMVTQHLG